MVDQTLLTIFCYTDKINEIDEMLSSENLKKNEINIVNIGDKSGYKELNEYKSSKSNSSFSVFLKRGSFFEPGSLVKLIKYLKTCDKDIVNIIPLQNMGDDREPGKYIKIKKIKESEYAYESIINLCLDSYVFRNSLISELKFSEDIYDDADDKFIIESLSKTKNVEYIDDVRIIYEETLNNDTKFYEKKKNKWWYKESLKKFILPLLALKPNTLAQKYLLYLIYLRFLCNKDSGYNEVIKAEQVDHFISTVSECLKYIDDEIIVNFGMLNAGIPKYMCIKFMEIKYSKLDVEIETDEVKKLDLKIHGLSIFRLNEEKINISNLNYYKESLVIDVNFPGRVYFDNGCDLVISVNGRETKLDETPTMNDIYYFGKWVYKSYSSKAVLPVGSLKSKSIIEFKIKYKNSSYKLNTIFKDPQSKMNDAWKINYWAFPKKIIKNDPKSSTLTVMRYNIFKVLKYELKIMKNLRYNGNKRELKVELLKMRLHYWFTRPYYKFKKVWLFFDKLYKGGDNGEYMFDYSVKQRDGISNYYIINDNVKDHRRLTDKYGKKRILPFQEREQKIKTLQSSVVLATHANVYGYCGLDTTERRFFSNLFNAKIACMRHGITIQYEANSQRRQRDNRVMVFCTSKYEKENFAQAAYDYEPEMLKLTGSTRFDGLKSNPQGIILIAPTWRRYLALPNKRIGNVREHNPLFKKSDYFKLYNQLINDKNLIDYLSERGYRIQFLLHPTFSPQIVDFDNKYDIEILAAADDVSYEKLLTEANVMVTDFSGIQFDFGFMKKPIVYYHPPELPPHLKEDTFKYSEMGFGPIAKTHEELVNCLKKVVDNNAEITPEYEARIEDFLAYTDRNNCKRVYDELIKL